MEKIKIDNFKKSNPNVSFPFFKTLNEKECNEIKNRICDLFEFSRRDNPLEFIKYLDKKQEKIGNFKIDNNSFNLILVLNKQCVRFEDKVFLNWYRFDKIDLMKIKDVSNFFTDIWYPTTDDIDIFDNSLNWILSISHYGVIKLIKR